MAFSKAFRTAQDGHQNPIITRLGARIDESFRRHTAGESVVLCGPHWQLIWQELWW